MFRQSDKRRRAVPPRRGLATVLAGLTVTGTGVGVLTGARAAAPTGQTGQHPDGGRQHAELPAVRLLRRRWAGHLGPALQPPGHRLRPERRRLHRRRPQPADPQDRRRRRHHAPSPAAARPTRAAPSRTAPPPPAPTATAGRPRQAVFNQPHGVGRRLQGQRLHRRQQQPPAPHGRHGSGTITTIAGTGDPKAPACPDKAQTCPAEGSGLKFPKSMFMAAGDQLYLADSGNGMIRKLDLTADPVTITTVAGNTQSRKYGGDGGRAVDAQLNTPEGVAVDTAGNLFIADSDNNLVRKVDTERDHHHHRRRHRGGPGGVRRQAARPAERLGRRRRPGQRRPPRRAPGHRRRLRRQRLHRPGSGDPATGQPAPGSAGSTRRAPSTRSPGPATPAAEAGWPATPARCPAGQAEFNTMHDVAVDSAGNLWIADSKNNLVRVIFDPADAPALGAPAPPSQPPASGPPGVAAAGRHRPPGRAGQSGYWMLGNDGRIYPLRRRQVDG